MSQNFTLALRLDWSPILNVLRRYWHLAGFKPAHGALTAYVRPARTPQCVCSAMHWINSSRCDTTPDPLNNERELAFRTRFENPL
jgi:hypothetical protein